MPYADASTMEVHMPVINADHKHYVFVSDVVDIEREYVFDGMTYNMKSRLKAGIYGFTNKADAISFISLCNRSSELEEIAFIANIAY